MFANNSYELPAYVLYSSPGTYQLDFSWQSVSDFKSSYPKVFLYILSYEHPVYVLYTFSGTYHYVLFLLSGTYQLGTAHSRAAGTKNSDSISKFYTLTSIRYHAYGLAYHILHKNGQ